MSIAIDVIGADGSEWPLLDPRTGVTLVGGIVGLHLPPVAPQWSEAARIPGRRRRGVNVGARSVTMRVHVGDGIAPHRQGSDWLRLDGSWWRALGGGEEPFTLRVTNGLTDMLDRPDVRTLQLWDESEDDGFAKDPELSGSAEYDVIAGAESAYWSGPEVARKFEYSTSDEEEYYGGPGGGGFGPPFYISGAQQFASAALPNPGDLPAYPRYRINAPFNSVVVGVGDDVVTLPFSQVKSQQVLIDTDPRVLSIVDAQGQDLWPLVGTAIDPIFAPVPPKSSTPLTIAMDGAAVGSYVEVSLTPLYRRAW